MRAVAALVSLLALAGCGYHLAGEQRDPLAPIVVQGGRALVPQVEALAAAEDGARSELSRGGALAAGADGESALVVEILRIEEISEGIASAPSARGALPLARGTRLAVSGRASLRRGGKVERETGDMRAADTFARDDEAARSLVQRREAIRRAARLLGERLARRLLGYPEPGEP